ncbi:bifunctional 4-hydroxy-2-oxoglutarate aldolase/2-dehydro-3-deoxy-phosphogluconate aldolase [Flavicella sediminum]|uniref:bifunctional 4-hydroxy-2-oxoglutarate aldolase/2-dehydro-3-deoxy-phosphogluconate aldolase n=1 Tax=Flavicella sediminum TaxID=2585141 RepID=UPI0011214CAC|nr:bifunctional 4-hydroxy-2-oxoglutarate aldolase/2-dehydro-3-deoxy-phosphogluconate aldolase [Flavicella sediminum]
MNRKEISELIQHEKIVFITRLKDSSKIQAVIGRLASAGVRILEVTSNTPKYTEAIIEARKSYPDILIGAGTVTNEKIANEAIKAGAQFLVTPNCNLTLIDIAHKNNIPILMGALTPTEVCEAFEAGADFVKLFPADIMGIAYFKSIKAPLDRVKILAVGNIKQNDVGLWMNAGATGIGIASILKEPIKDEQDLIDIEQNAINFIKHIKKNHE